MRLLFLLIIDVIALNQAYFGPGNIPIVIDDVQCTGTEDHLINCTFDNNVNDCNHGEDAGVACISGGKFMFLSLLRAVIIDNAVQRLALLEM